MLRRGMTDSGNTAVPESGGYSAGDVIAGKYRLDTMLGEGGQALVWRARNLSLEADVAIKLVRPDSEDRAPMHRLLREARAAARLGHPAIVRVFDLGETDAGDPFLVMELLSGEDLSSLLTTRRALLPSEAVRTLLPIADALVTAHAQGIIHRDLKPANVFLSRSGDHTQPKLLDFGIVKFRVPTSRPEAITNDGMVIGSLAYLSPEQARGLADIDERADVWCFCAMLYECLTGETPFQGASYNKLLRSIVEDEPRSLLERGVADLGLSEIVKRGLNKSTDERFQSMEELGTALAVWLREHGEVDDIAGVSLSSRWLRNDVARIAAATTTVASNPDRVETVARIVENVTTLAPPTALGVTTEASFSSRPKPRVGNPARRHWYVIGVTATVVAGLGILVTAALDSGERARGEDLRALATETLAAGVAPLPRAVAGAHSPGEPRVQPEARASLDPPSAPAPVPSAAIESSPPAGDAKVRTSTVKGDAGPSASAAAVKPAPKVRPVPMPAPRSKQTDLLNPY